MAAESLRLAEAHRLAQHGLGVETMGVLYRVFPVLDLTALEATTPAWLRLVTPVIGAQYRRSAELAGGYVQAARALDVGPTAWLPPPVSFSAEQVATSMTVTGPIEARRLTGLGRPLAEVRRAVLNSSSSAGMRLAMSGGRDRIIAAVKADDRALGYARVGSGHACGFCSMLISRGPVYSKGTADFRAHDRCSCGARPVYRRADGWSPQAKALRDLWGESTAGKSGRDALNAFRTAVEAG
jgi:hypothetical protein